MSKHYSLLFLWSKGAGTRRKILRIIFKQQESQNPVYISEITKLFNKSLKDNEHSVTNSSIRKHIKVLKEYNLIKPINEGGRPEYLELTEEGRFVLEKLRYNQN